MFCIGFLWPVAISGLTAKKYHDDIYQYNRWPGWGRAATWLPLALGTPCSPKICLLVLMCVGLLGLEEEGGFGVQAVVVATGRWGEWGHNDYPLPSLTPPPALNLLWGISWEPCWRECGTRSCKSCSWRMLGNPEPKLLQGPAGREKW